jgi:hypothetical protein
MNKLSILTIAAIAAATVMTSCSKEYKVVNNEDGRLTFASQVNGDPQARATSGNSWEGTETVRVNVNGNEYPFSVSTQGVLTSSTLRWSDIASVDAFAWYPGTYNYPVDQSSGIQAADFIFADKVTGITRDNYGDEVNKLIFKHKTAKVTVTLVSGDGNPDLTGAIVKFRGYTAVSAIDNAGTTPSGAITGQTPGWITPFTDATAAETKTALLLPVDFSTKTSIFEIELADGNKYYYNSTYTFEGEKAYTFTVTVNKSGVAVESKTITDWSDEGDETGDTEDTEENI